MDEKKLPPLWVMLESLGAAYHHLDQHQMDGAGDPPLAEMARLSDKMFEILLAAYVKDPQLVAMIRSLPGYQRLEKAETALRPVYQPDSDQKPDAGHLIFYANCAFALAVLEKRRSDWPHSERFRELISDADRACELFRGSIKWEPASEDQHADMECLQGLVWVELFSINAADGNYEYALNRLSNGLCQLEDYGEDAPDFDPQQAVHCFEMLRAQPDKVADWADVALSCETLADRLLNLGFDGQAEVKDDKGDARSWRDYWWIAYGFAQSRLSPDEYRRWKEREEREHAERHMEHLFFPGTWKQLSELARDALVQAEVVWWNRDRSTKSTVVDNLWKATLEIVLERLWTPFVQYSRSLPIESLQGLRTQSLFTDGSDEPRLSDLIRATWQDPRFPEFAKSLGSGQAE